MKSLGGLFFYIWGEGKWEGWREGREGNHDWDVIYERLIIIKMKSQ